LLAKSVTIPITETSSVYLHPSSGDKIVISGATVFLTWVRFSSVMGEGQETSINKIDKSTIP